MEAESLRGLEEQIGNDFAAAVQAIHQISGKVVVTGVGKSAIIGQKMVATLNSTGSKAIFLHAADAIHGDLGVVNADDIVLALSKSGETSELKKLWPHLRVRVRQIIAMAARPQSFAASNADFFLYTPVPKEADPNDLAPTSSSIVQLALGDALAICLQELANFKAVDFARLHPGGSLGKLLTLRIDQMGLAAKKPMVRADRDIREVIYEISKHRLGATAVLDAEDNVVGIITDGDLRRMLQTHQNPLSLRATDIMSKKPKVIRASSLAKQAADILRREKINHLIVLDAADAYKGILHIQDVLNEGLI